MQFWASLTPVFNARWTVFNTGLGTPLRTVPVVRSPPHPPLLVRERAAPGAGFAASSLGQQPPARNIRTTPHTLAVMHWSCMYKLATAEQLRRAADFACGLPDLLA